jgi:hypothetical protein
MDQKKRKKLTIRVGNVCIVPSIVTSYWFQTCLSHLALIFLEHRVLCVLKEHDDCSQEGRIGVQRVFT